MLALAKSHAPVRSTQSTFSARKFTHIPCPCRVRHSTPCNTPLSQSLQCKHTALPATHPCHSRYSASTQHSLQHTRITVVTVQAHGTPCNTPVSQSFSASTQHSLQHTRVTVVTVQAHSTPSNTLVSQSLQCKHTALPATHPCHSRYSASTYHCPLNAMNLRAF